MAAGINPRIDFDKEFVYASVTVPADGNIEYQAKVKRTPAFDALPIAEKRETMRLALKEVRDMELAKQADQTRQSIAISGTITL